MERILRTVAGHLSCWRSGQSPHDANLGYRRDSCLLVDNALHVIAILFSSSRRSPAKRMVDAPAVAPRRRLDARPVAPDGNMKRSFASSPERRKGTATPSFLKRNSTALCAMSTSSFSVRHRTDSYVETCYPVRSYCVLRRRLAVT